MRRLLGVAAALAVGVSLLAGCSGGSAAFPTGKWTATVWVMDYRSDGTFLLTDAGTKIDTGTYSTDATTITFKTDEYCTAVNAEQATYAWQHANDQLTLTKQTDSCTDRIGVLDGTAWKPAT